MEYTHLSTPKRANNPIDTDVTTRRFHLGKSHLMYPKYATVPITAVFTCGPNFRVNWKPIKVDIPKQLVAPE